MRHNRYYQLTAFVLLLSPLLSLPFIIYGIYQRQKGCKTLLAVFMGLCAFMTAPAGDLYRHTLTYYSYESITWRTAVNSTMQEDFIMWALSYLMAKASIPYEFLRLIYTTIAYCILNYISGKLMNSSLCSYSKKQHFYRYLLVFMSFGFFQLVLGVRFGLACTFFLLATYFYIYEKKYVKFIVCLLLSIGIHSSFLYYSLLYFFFMKLKLSRSMLYISIILCIAFSALILVQLENYLISQGSYYAGYMGNGKWGYDTEKQQDTINVIFEILRKLSILPTILYLLKIFREKDKLHHMMFALVLLIALSLRLNSVSGRTVTIFILFTPMFLLGLELKGKPLPRFFLNTVFLCSTAIYLATLYGMRNPRRLSNYSYLAAPTPVILTHQYDIFWMYKNIDKEGKGK